MDNVLALLALVALAFLALSWPRLTSKARIIRRLYRHVDEPLGARRFENDRRASRRRLMGWFSRDLANLMYPTAQLGGAAALPSTKRMRRYVQVEWGTRPRWPNRWHVWHIQAVVLRWTSEANALGEGFGTLLTRKVAQALILKSASELEQQPAFDRGFFRLERAKPAAPVPTGVPFGEATDE